MKWFRDFFNKNKFGKNDNKEQNIKIKSNGIDNSANITSIGRDFLVNKSNSISDIINLAASAQTLINKNMIILDQCKTFKDENFKEIFEKKNKLANDYDIGKQWMSGNPIIRDASSEINKMQEEMNQMARFCIKTNCKKSKHINLIFENAENYKKIMLSEDFLSRNNNGILK